jgi:hypothetical protein
MLIHGRPDLPDLSMPRHTRLLAFLALLGITAAMIAAFASRPTAPRSHETPAAPRRLTSPAAPPHPSTRIDAPTRVAIAYALAARNWTAARYMASWRTQVRLSAGRYRRALRTALPSRAQLRALRVDRARSQARVLAVRRERATHRTDVPVLVALQESTSAGVSRIVGVTTNVVRLRRAAGHWRVVGWTVLPDDHGSQLRLRDSGRH